MKKIKWILVLLMIILLGIFLINRSEIKSDIKSEIKMKTSAEVKLNLFPAIQSKASAPAPDQEQDQKIKELESIENNWLLKIKKSLNDQQYSYYLVLRNNCEEEKLKAYQQFHHDLQKNSQATYYLSEDVGAEEKTINQHYLKKLLDEMGSSGFNKYLEIKDQFNEELRRNNKEYIQIEF